jgi:hypothetical protein
LVVPELVDVEVVSVRWELRVQKQQRTSRTDSVSPGDSWRVGPKRGEVVEGGRKKDLVAAQDWEAVGEPVVVTSTDGSEPKRPDDLEPLDGKLYRWSDAHEITFEMRGPDGESYQLVVRDLFAMGMRPEFVLACAPKMRCKLELDDRNRPWRIWPPDRAP